MTNTKDFKSRFIIGNRHFNLKDWEGEKMNMDDPSLEWLWWHQNACPYGWDFKYVSKLSENGVAGLILANGATSGGGEETKSP